MTGRLLGMMVGRQPRRDEMTRPIRCLAVPCRRQSAALLLVAKSPTYHASQIGCTAYAREIRPRGERLARETYRSGFDIRNDGSGRAQQYFASHRRVSLPALPGQRCAANSGHGHLPPRGDHRGARDAALAEALQEPNRFRENVRPPQLSAHGYSAGTAEPHACPSLLIVGLPVDVHDHLPHLVILD